MKTLELNDLERLYNKSIKLLNNKYYSLYINSKRKLSYMNLDWDCYDLEDEKLNKFINRMCLLLESCIYENNYDGMINLLITIPKEIIIYK
ncbi:hypothetical protein DVV91_10130 [Clostridium botulinum]|uniref:hypothetical protein n=1 Tax=Clostridium botulinum TaxID=1491 RepID=UPI0019679985|nr:hypothetical protein [Clostridium botulinum]MBN1074699.1 hypothetical protein [Clostridium botulinum]